MKNSNRRKIKSAAIACSLVLLSLASRSRAASTIGNGSVVSMHYTLKVAGKLVDSSAGKSPLVFTQGNKQIIPGLEEKLAGLKAGDKKHVQVAPEKGYGKFNPGAVQKVPKEALKNVEDLKVGTNVVGQAGNQPVQGIVKEIGKDTVTVDFNHSLAGKTLEFDIEIVDVQPPKKI